jgi:hypothetical protein
VLSEILARVESFSLIDSLALAEAALSDSDAYADWLATLLADWLALANTSLVDADAEADRLALNEAAPIEAEADSLALTDASLVETDALWLCASYILLSSDSRAETLSCVLVEILS